MRAKIVLIPGLVAVAVFAQETVRSIWDGVYTEAQAKRGKPHYDRKCADCHGEELEGDAEAPALSGSEFLWKWNGLTLDRMFERIHRDMPLNEARTLSREVTADLLAYILQVNTMPPGKTELPPDQQALKQIRIKPTNEP
jgi:mono/diheme cytochrome c family protein